MIGLFCRNIWMVWNKLGALHCWRCPTAVLYDEPVCIENTFQRSEGNGHKTIHMHTHNTSNFHVLTIYMYFKLQQGVYSTTFKVPDVYGVFQFKVEYQRLGYTSLSLSEQVCVLCILHPIPFDQTAIPWVILFFIFICRFLFDHSDTMNTKGF